MTTTQKPTAKSAPGAKAPAERMIALKSAQSEGSPFPLVIGVDNTFQGAWDSTRRYVTWHVPASLMPQVRKHRHFVTGRIIKTK